MMISMIMFANLALAIDWPPCPGCLTANDNTQDITVAKKKKGETFCFIGPDGSYICIPN